jgi:GntP family gluconate:H+ symporter
MIDAHSLYLLAAALLSVVGLIALIAVVKLNPVITLLLASLALAAMAGMPLPTVIHSFESGVGAVLGHIAVVVGLGTMLGKMMAESGASEQIAFTLLRVFGEKRVPWAMMTIAMLVGLPAFFEVGFVLLVPILFTVVRRTKTPIVLAGLPMVAGLSVVHGLVPPHPAAMMAVTAFHADVGRTIFFALLVAVPVAIVAGPLYAMFITPHVAVTGENAISAQLTTRDEGRKLPSFRLSVLAIVLPVLLMLVGSWADGLTRAGSGLNSFLHLAGNDDIALLIGALFSFATLGAMRGFSRTVMLKFSNECLAPTAAITLLIGAGGGFGRVLSDSGVATAIITVALHSHMPLLLLAWLLAALVRLATGSSTVGMTTAASIIAPIALQTGCPHPELLAIATGGGALIFSHVNDGGFWLVKEYYNLSVADTFKTWSVAETLISVISLLLAAGLWFVI